jgi:hypothetical protein
MVQIIQRSMLSTGYLGDRQTAVNLAAGAWSLSYLREKDEYL